MSWFYWHSAKKFCISAIILLVCLSGSTICTCFSFSSLYSLAFFQKVLQFVFLSPTFGTMSFIFGISIFNEKEAKFLWIRSEFLSNFYVTSSKISSSVSVPAFLISGETLDNISVSDFKEIHIKRRFHHSSFENIYIIYVWIDNRISRLIIF